MPEKPARGLYDDEPAPPVSVDTTPEVKVEDFDPKAFIDGMRPHRRAVFITSRGDLVARARVLMSKIDTTPKGAALDALIDEYDDLKTEWAEGGQWWEVEGRSRDWVVTRRQKYAERQGIDLSDDVEKLQGVTYEERTDIVLDQLVGQIAHPKGVTRDLLDEMMEHSEPEVSKLLVEMTMTNSESSTAYAEIFHQDFSSRRSGNRRQRRSSPRSK